MYFLHNHPCITALMIAVLWEILPQRHLVPKCWDQKPVSERSFFESISMIWRSSVPSTLWHWHHCSVDIAALNFSCRARVLWVPWSGVSYFTCSIRRGVSLRSALTFVRDIDLFSSSTTPVTLQHPRFETLLTKQQAVAVQRPTTVMR
jgi:hypothetical protein